MGVVVHLEPLEHMGRRPYREVMLMDSRYFSTSIVRKHIFCMHKQLRVLYDKISRWNLIVVGVWCDLLNRNALCWELAKANNSIVIGTMLKHNPRHSNCSG